MSQNKVAYGAVTMFESYWCILTKVSYIIYYGLELEILAPAQVKWSNYRLIIPNEYNEGKKGI